MSMPELRLHVLDTPFPLHQRGEDPTERPHRHSRNTNLLSHRLRKPSQTDVAIERCSPAGGEHQIAWLDLATGRPPALQLQLEGLRYRHIRAAALRVGPANLTFNDRLIDWLQIALPVIPEKGKPRSSP